MKIDKEFLVQHLGEDPHKGQIITHILLYVFNEKGEVLLFKRKKPPFIGLWEAPGGHINFGELSLDAAKRELLEETGIISDELKFVKNFEFILPNGFHRIGITYATKVNSKESIKLQEHEECKWFKINELPKEMIPGPVEEAYKKIFEV